MRIAILTNVNLDLLLQLQAKKNDVFETQGYGQWIHYALNDSKELTEFAPHSIFVILDGFELLEECKSKEDGFTEIDRAMSQLISLANRYPGLNIAVSSIDIPVRRIDITDEQPSEDAWCSYWNENLDRITMTMPHVHRFDLARYVHEFGRADFYSEKMWYMGSIPYSMKGIKLLSEQIDNFVSHLSMTRKKVLILDLDNTLWGGVLGEDGPLGITLGASLLGAVYRDAQKRIKELKYLGVLLAIVSKNNMAEVDALFSQNSQMVLEKSDFVSILANWDDKPSNIQRLAQQLSLGMDSFVFLDDNEVERELVRRTLPMVEVVEFPKDVANLPATIRDIYNQYFWQWTITDEDRSKTMQYREEALRKIDFESAASMDDYLLSLNMNIQIGEMQKDQIERVVQLIGKTNQFNTCTLRCDLSGLKAYGDNGGTVYTVNVSDKYGDSGLVSVLMVKIEEEAAAIENFLMSCRVMGRQIEHAILEAVESKLYGKGVKKLNASYIPSDRNKPVEELWDRLGFEMTGASENGSKQYVKLLPSSPTNSSLIKANWKE